MEKIRPKKERTRSPMYDWNASSAPTTTCAEGASTKRSGWVHLLGRKLKSKLRALVEDNAGSDGVLPVPVTATRSLHDVKSATELVQVLRSQLKAKGRALLDEFEEATKDAPETVPELVEILLRNIDEKGWTLVEDWAALSNPASSGA